MTEGMKIDGRFRRPNPTITASEAPESQNLVEEVKEENDRNKKTGDENGKNHTKKTRKQQ